ncbi:unnamed protein product [Protopolystoma xenopodis]|uniref:Uncharacterized protein n=1 Tax=Protopolystoma xenopodis TaxID=117903 RepID=A0A3S5BRW8_9PLAT|nr:unnamed protein product [Protopolystoma xenopodis]
MTCNEMRMSTTLRVTLTTSTSRTSVFKTRRPRPSSVMPAGRREHLPLQTSSCDLFEAIRLQGKPTSKSVSVPSRVVPSKGGCGLLLRRFFVISLLTPFLPVVKRHDPIIDATFPTTGHFMPTSVGICIHWILTQKCRSACKFAYSLIHSSLLPFPFSLLPLVFAQRQSMRWQDELFQSAEIPSVCMSISKL